MTKKVKTTPNTSKIAIIIEITAIFAMNIDFFNHSHFTNFSSNATTTIITTKTARIISHVFKYG